MTGSSSRTGNHPRTVMIVDDDLNTLSITGRILDHLGIVSITSNRAFGVLNLIAAYRPELVLLDLNMPGIDGASLVVLVRQDPELRRTRILLHSATGEDRLAQQTKACGADGYIAKSRGLAHLQQRLTAWLK